MIKGKMFSQIDRRQPYHPLLQTPFRQTLQHNVIKCFDEAGESAAWCLYHLHHSICLGATGAFVLLTTREDSVKPPKHLLLKRNQEESHLDIITMPSGTGWKRGCQSAQITRKFPVYNTTRDRLCARCCRGKCGKGKVWSFHLWLLKKVVTAGHI